MFAAVQSLAQALLLPAMLVFLMVVGVIALLIGLSLIIRSDMLWRVSEYANRWVSFRRILKPAEITRDSWAAIERNRRWLAVAISVGALYTIYVLVSLNIPAIAARTAAGWRLNNVQMAWLLQSAQWFVVLGNLVGLVVALMLAFAPEQLARLNSISARWISTRNATRSVDRNVLGFDDLVARWPRAAGALITAFALVEIVCISRVMH